MCVLVSYNQQWGVRWTDTSPSFLLCLYLKFNFICLFFFLEAISVLNLTRSSTVNLPLAVRINNRIFLILGNGSDFSFSVEALSGIMENESSTRCLWLIAEVFWCLGLYRIIYGLDRSSAFIWFVPYQNQLFHEVLSPSSSSEMLV